MELDELIVQLGEKLDSWWDGFSAMLDSQDRVAQGKALLRGYEIAKEFKGLKAKGLAAITALLNRQDPIADDERAASLVRGFEFAAKLKAALLDELRDTDGSNKVVLLTNEIATALDAVGAGRTVLAELLNHPNDGVRASAGAYLLIDNLMADRVVPVLRKLEERNYGLSADFTAHWALLEWDLKEKARGN